MTAHSRMVHVRVDDEIRNKAATALEAVGLSLSDGVRLFLHRVVVENGYPLELKLPSAETRLAIEEADKLLKEGAARSMTPEGVFNELDDVEKTAGK
ncbi:hypothetical protein GCM10007874_04800 [Labrys miyagiensis]|uniref:DNA-damage-inducible protein J n=1 Tax=Labrys miyagiensis TaxID=346912 RepID=A0ABQ6CBD4_9HYPH|nr:type II toxin-antitoxin system RelB/DinJ family antitoxin [Labrys miyagiensis]GLS17465.1 hypothetical protein GCM10007874_04800 [Labrys miyagiensis]